MSLYKHAKNWAISRICSGDIVDLEILHSDWLTPFWPICQEPDFFQI